jgi:hypothetical protein
LKDAMLASRRERTVVGLAIVGVALVAVAGFTLSRYAREHLRKPPLVDSCFVFLRPSLAALPDASGTERHEFDDGEVVYLREEEDKAVRCAFQFVSDAYAERVARALGEPEPESRARAVRALVEQAPPGPRGDAEFEISTDIASGVLGGLPHSPVVDEASFVIAESHACRFGTDEPCARRPPLPWLVPALGLPGVAALIPGLALALGAALRRIRAEIATAKW